MRSCLLLDRCSECPGTGNLGAAPGPEPNAVGAPAQTSGSRPSQFYLDSLVDLSLTWHWLQHGVLFLGGLAAGEGAYGLYLIEQRRGGRGRVR